MATESSVLVNLKDLFEMEADRRAEEAAAKEREKAEARAREEAERRAREKAIAEAREEERQRAEEERARRDEELEARVRMMRDELMEVRAQREEMRLKVAEIAARPAPSGRRGWVAGAMAAVSLVAAITATAVAWPREEPAVAHVSAPVIEVTTPAPVVETQPEPIAEPVVEVSAPQQVAAVEPTRPVTRHPRVRQPRRTEEDALNRQLDFGGGNDVLSDDFLNGAGR